MPHGLPLTPPQSAAYSTSVSVSKPDIYIEWVSLGPPGSQQEAPCRLTSHHRLFGMELSAGDVSLGVSVPPSTAEGSGSAPGSFSSSGVASCGQLRCHCRFQHWLCRGCLSPRGAGCVLTGVRRALLGARPAGAGSPILLFAAGSRLAPVLLGCPWGGRAALWNASPQNSTSTRPTRQQIRGAHNPPPSPHALLCSHQLTRGCQVLHAQTSHAQSTACHPSRWPGLKTTAVALRSEATERTVPKQRGVIFSLPAQY